MTPATRSPQFFLGALAVGLTGCALLGYVLVRRQLYDQFDEPLQAALRVLSGEVEIESDAVKWKSSERNFTLGAELSIDHLWWVVFNDRGQLVDSSLNLSTAIAANRVLLELAQPHPSRSHANPLRPANAHAGPGETWRLLQARIAAPSPKDEEDRRHDELAAVTITVARTTASLDRALWQLLAVAAVAPTALWLVAALITRHYALRDADASTAPDL